MTIAEQYRTARQFHRWTQEELAARSGVSRATIVAVEAGKGAQSRKLERLAAALRTRIVIGGDA